MKRTVFHISLTCDTDIASNVLSELCSYDDSRYNCSLWTSEEEVEPSTNNNNNDYTND